MPMRAIRKRREDVAVLDAAGVYATVNSSDAMSTAMMRISSGLLSRGHVRTSMSTSGER